MSIEAPYPWAYSCIRMYSHLLLYSNLIETLLCKHRLPPFATYQWAI